jgi:hypothetical protein
MFVMVGVFSVMSYSFVKIKLSEAGFHVTTGLDRFQEGFPWSQDSFYGVGAKSIAIRRCRKTMIIENLPDAFKFFRSGPDRGVQGQVIFSYITLKPCYFGKFIRFSRKDAKTQRNISRTSRFCGLA